MKALAQFLSQYKSAGHTIVVVTGIAVTLYLTNKQFQADALAVWAYIPAWLKPILGMAGIIAGVYMNFLKNNGSGSGSSSAPIAKSGAAGSPPVAILALTMVLVLSFQTACGGNLPSDLQQASEIATILPAGINLIPPLICAVDSQRCVNATAKAQMVNYGLTNLSSLFTQWSSAAESAQPGILAQIQAAIPPIEGNLEGLISAVGVKNPATAATAKGIITASLDELSELAQVIPEIQASGGTTATLWDVFSETDIREARRGIWTPFSIFGEKDSITTRAGHKVHSAKYFKQRILEQLKQSGDPQAEAVRQKAIKQVKAWKL